MTNHSLLAASLISAGTICSYGNLIEHSQSGPSSNVSSSSSVVDFYDGAPRGGPASTPRPAAPSTPHPSSNFTSPIPEPATALFGLALCGFAAIRRRR